ncbi:MAG TPA: N-acetylmuramoyl-L-alanine amidase [Bacteroidia bacterium]|jgi:N-acetylmuramoyl-L-alanine amidase|nr:N-acetylmuramoyl-L-alanine amidase [Bacteroidia bacterium]
MAYAQSYQQVKSRFDNYLNYHGSLNAQVKIESDKIIFYNAQKQIIFILLKSDWQKMAALLKIVPEDSLEKIFLNEATLKNYKTPVANSVKKNLSELKIVIDPGHIAGNHAMAHVEQKYLHFTKQNAPELKQDSVDVAEGILTFQTASILKAMLQEKGVTVNLTRKENSTSFGCTYDEWIKDYKKKTLDSLLSSNKITAQKHRQLINENPSKFFIDFFKDYELQQRARVINALKPDMTIIIHYNVDEKNTDWKKPSDKNFCMTFMPGCLIGDNIKTTQGKLNLLRLLLTDDLDESEKISGLVVNQLSQQLKIPVANKTNATYLSEHCLTAPSNGVYSRNLALCRMVQTPLVYGECLYQDCENECYSLLQNTETVYGIKTNKRVVLAAQSFYNAVIQFYTK